MSTYRLNTLLTFALVVTVVAPISANTQETDVFQYKQKRAKTVTVRRYCGPSLSNALQELCGGTYNPMFKKSGQELEMDDYPFFYESYPFRSRASANAMMARFSARRLRRQSRGVHEECCVNSCTVEELLSYCGR